MNCNEARRLLDAQVDGELDLSYHLDVEAHLRACSECSRIYETLRERRAALSTNLTRFSAPVGLAEKIRASLPAPSSSVVAVAASTVTSRPRFSMWNLGGIAAGLVCAALVGFSFGTSQSRVDGVFEEAFSEHVRSLQVDHLTDVASTDQHTVKPWFAGKLDFSPPVVDLASVGFPLTGGRLDRINGRVAAALIFHRRQHAINVFIWPSNAKTVASRAQQRDGFQALAWSAGSFNYLAVSEIPAEELKDFAEHFRRAVK